MHVEGETDLHSTIPVLCLLDGFMRVLQRDWYVFAEQPALAPHLAHPGGCAALRIVLVTVP